MTCPTLLPLRLALDKQTAFGNGSDASLSVDEFSTFLHSMHQLSDDKILCLPSSKERPQDSTESTCKCVILYIWGGVEQQPHRAMFASKKGSSVAVVLWLFIYKASFFFWRVSSSCVMGSHPISSSSHLTKSLIWYFLKPHSSRSLSMS